MSLGKTFYYDYNVSLHLGVEIGMADIMLRVNWLWKPRHQASMKVELLQS